MRSWQVVAPLKAEVIVTESPSLGAGDVKVKITKAGIARSDLLVFQGKIKHAKYPAVIGRHAVGIVVETGEDVKHIARGNRVVIDPYILCDECLLCKDEDTCENLLTAGVNGPGLMRDLVTVDQACLKVLPEHLSDSDALFVECTAVAGKSLDRLDLNKGDHIVIFGATITGLIAAQAAIYYQMIPIIVDWRADRLKVAEKLGVYYVIDSGQVDAYKKILAITGGHMAPALIHCVETPYKLQNSLECVVKNGKAVLVGFLGGTTQISVDLLTAFERQISISCVNNGAKNLTGAINMLASKSVAVADLIGKEVDFSDVGATLEELVKQPEKFIKVAVNFK